MHTKPSFKIIRENILLSENQKEKHRSKNSLYYTEKNSCFVRVFFEILYTLFTFHFTIEKIPLYNTEKNSSFVDVFLEKFINLFGKIKNGHHLSYHITRNNKYEIADQVWCVFAIM